MSGNPFKERNWLLPKDYLVTENKKEDTTIDTAKPPLRISLRWKNKTPARIERNVAGALTAPFASPKKKEGEDQQQQTPLPKPQVKRPDTLSFAKMRQQWEAEMERLNTKYNIDFFSDSKLDSESDEDEQYQYEHGCEALI